MIYLDNAATSWPKPPEVIKAMTEALEKAGGNPGRSGHRLSIEAARIIYDARESAARLFGTADPQRVIFTSNATHALNLAIRGILKPGDKAATTSIEHNAVMRPLRSLERQGVELSILPCTTDGCLDPAQLSGAIAPGTKLVIMTHASNVTGTILPVKEMAGAAHEAGALLLVDASQSAGVLTIDMKTDGIDLLAFTGHKEVQGPPGAGGLVIAENVDTALMEPLMRGGTGSRSESEEQPDELPDKYESGTPNLVGIAGLGAGIRWMEEKGVPEVRQHLEKLRKMLIEGLGVIRGIRVHGPESSEQSVGIVSFTAAGKHVSGIGFRLDEEYGILTRVGLHCAPAAHRTIGTFPEGTVRMAPGVFTTVNDISAAVEAVSKAAQQ